MTIKGRESQGQDGKRVAPVSVAEEAMDLQAQGAGIKNKQGFKDI